MWLPEDVVGELRQRGYLWDAMPGLPGLRGPLLGLAREIEARIAGVAGEETSDEWRVPSGIAFETLETAHYFASFPQWLTAASHLSGDEAVLEKIATSSSPGQAARGCMSSASAALSPAVCYHTYAALAGTSIAEPRLMTAEATCWRYEGDLTAALARGWAFQMREIVFLGAAREAEGFRRRGMLHAIELADSLGIPTTILEATDPFFAPTSRGRSLLQRLKALKHELTIEYCDGRQLAIASFNNHETFFGEAFGISLPDESPASSACVAYGLDRWLLAFLVAHGPDEAAWPAIGAASKELSLKEY